MNTKISAVKPYPFPVVLMREPEPAVLTQQMIYLDGGRKMAGRAYLEGSFSVFSLDHPFPECGSEIEVECPTRSGTKIGPIMRGRAMVVLTEEESVTEDGVRKLTGLTFCTWRSGGSWETADYTNLPQPDAIR